MNIVTHERDGEVVHLPGRLVNWLHTPEKTGGRYSSVCVVTYEPGARAKPAHAHDKGEETIYAVSGAGKVKVGGSVYPLEPGSLILFPQGVPHMVYNTSDVPLKLVCFYAPSAGATEYTYYEDFDFDERE